MSVVHNIIVGINRWEDITRPFIDSILKHEPEAKIILIDNHSTEPYPAEYHGIMVVRTDTRMGYAQALNVGIKQGKADWYVCFNNDCVCDGKYLSVIEQCDPNIVYGSKWGFDEINNRKWVESAWLILSQKVLDTVGKFDAALDAGFEDFDMELRAEKAGFKLDVANLNIRHRNISTRFHEPSYIPRWEKCRKYFGEKHNYQTKPWFNR